MGSTDRRDTEVADVSLADYATVRAGLDDGLPLEAMLSWVGLVAERWEAVDAAWQAALLRDLSAGMELQVAFDEARAQAMLGWSRPLPPLDDDLQAYFDFDRAHAFAMEPERFLAALGMRPADVTRLAALWKRRFDADPALAERAAAILAEPENALPAVTPEPPSLPPSSRRERSFGKR